MAITYSRHGSRDHDFTARRDSFPLRQFRSERHKVWNYELISDFESIADWVNVSGAQAADTTHFKEGSQGIMFTSINAVSSTADRTIALDCLGKHFTIWIYVDNIDNLSNIALRFLAPNLANYFGINLAGWSGLMQGWNEVTICRGDFTFPAAPDWDNVQGIRAIVVSNAGTTVNVTFDDFRMVTDRFPGLVILRFDDGYVSQYTEARARMDRYGFRGVLSCVVNFVGGAGWMTLDQLKHLQERGWDIASHTMTHSHLPAISDAEVVKELENSQKWLIENGFFKGSRFITLPYHEWNAAVMEKIKKYYLATQTEPTSRLSVVPPAQYYMRFDVVGDADPVATLTASIDTTIAYQGCLTLLFHIIGVGGYPAANFQSVLDYLYNNNVKVVTFSDVFDEDIILPYSELLEFGVQGAITPNATSYPCPGGGVAAQTANEIKIPISRIGRLKNLRVRQRVASGAAGRTDVYTVRVNGVNTAITCTLDNATVGSDRIHSVVVDPGDEVSLSLVSNNAADTSADISITLELEID